MKMALKEAQRAYDDGEVPVGAVIVKSGKVIAKARNMRESKQNALYHAEILAIDKACKKLKSFRLDDCEIYVTLEPCPMCAGAICGARLKEVVFGAKDKNYGCAGSKHNFFSDPDFEHLATVTMGVMAQESEALLQKFFSEARRRNKMTKLIGSPAKLLPQNLSTNNDNIVDKIKNISSNIVQRECMADGEIYPCVVTNAENNIILGIIRTKNESVLILGKEMSEDDLLQYAKKSFLSGCKLITKMGKHLI